MELQPTPRPAPPLRAADADRERAADVIRAAGSDGRLTVEELEYRMSAVFAARTHIEIEALLADLGSVVVAAPGAAVRTTSDRPETHRTVAIMGGADRGGVWRPAQESRVLAIMGGADIDLTEAELTHPVTTIRVTSIMAGVEIRVPDGAEVHVSKVSIMGGADVKLGDTATPAGAPVIHLKLVSIMGGVEVRRGRKRSRREKREDEQKRRELDP